MPPVAPATPAATAASPATKDAPLVRGWLITLGLTLLWDLSGADLAVMHLIGSPHGFALRDHWVLSRVLHDGLRQVALLTYLALVLWATWPRRWQRGTALWAVPRRERVAVVLLVTLSLIVVNIVKSRSLTSCPWELQAFGGVAHYVSHWSLGVADGGTGRCFPGGHASSAYALLPLCLPWLMPPSRKVRSREAGWVWLGTLLLTGLVAGAAQTLRGAHYPSHTLWTLVICAGVSLAGWRIAQRWMT